jgi:hypothetical protein
MISAKCCRERTREVVLRAVAGTPHAVFGIAPEELRRVTDAEVADVTE